MSEFERTEAGNLTDEGIRQYLQARFKRITKIKDQRIKELEAKLEQHRWIPVSERLPEKTEEDLRPEVLVYDGESVTGALWRHYNFGWDFETDRGKPTYWKPIILP